MIPAPLTRIEFDSVKLENGIFSHWYVTKDINSAYSPDTPTEWDYLTIMDANFNGTLEAGNVAYDLSQIEGIKIKRRKITDYDWVTLDFVLISEIGTSLSFSINDNLAQNGIEYEYAFVPVIIAALVQPKMVPPEISAAMPPTYAWPVRVTLLPTWQFSIVPPCKYDTMPPIQWLASMRQSLTTRFFTVPSTLPKMALYIP